MEIPTLVQDNTYWSGGPRVPSNYLWMDQISFGMKQSMKMQKVTQSSKKRGSDQLFSDLRVGTLPWSCSLCSWVSKAGFADLWGRFDGTDSESGVLKPGEAWSSDFNSLIFHLPPGTRDSNANPVYSWCEHNIRITNTNGATENQGTIVL